MNNTLKISGKGLMKKGVVFCIIGVLTLGLVACGEKDKKAELDNSKIRTEQSADKKTLTKNNSTEKKSSVQNTNKSSSMTKEKKNN